MRWVLNARKGPFECVEHLFQQLKRLNQSVFPVSYNEKFYKDVLTSGNLSKLAYFNDIVVGGVCCRVDSRENENTKAVYIMTLGALAPYRYPLPSTACVICHVQRPNIADATGLEQCC